MRTVHPFQILTNYVYTQAKSIKCSKMCYTTLDKYFLPYKIQKSYITLFLIIGLRLAEGDTTAISRYSTRMGGMHTGTYDPNVNSD